MSQRWQLLRKLLQQCLVLSAAGRQPRQLVHALLERQHRATAAAPQRDGPHLDLPLCEGGHSGRLPDLFLNLWAVARPLAAFFSEKFEPTAAERVFRSAGA